MSSEAKIVAVNFRQYDVTPGYTFIHSCTECIHEGSYTCHEKRWEPCWLVPTPTNRPAPISCIACDKIEFKQP